MRRLVKFGQRGRDDHGDRVATMRTELARSDRSLQAEFERVMAALGRGAVIIIGLGIALSALGLVTAWPHRSFDGLEVRAGLGVEQPAQP